jgi:two-component system, cell cycle sensor histidine kinase and response regulator CckA
MRHAGLTARLVVKACVVAGAVAAIVLIRGQPTRQVSSQALSIAIALLALVAVAGVWSIPRRSRRRAVEAELLAARLLELRRAQKMDSLGQLAAGVAHDFNNLLTGVIGYVSLVLNRLPADDVNRRPLQTVLETSFRAAALTKQLLAYGQRQEHDRGAIGTRQLIDGIKGLVAGAVRDDMVVTYVQDKNLPVFVERSEIEQVLLNLVINAQDATPGAGSIEIGVRERELGRNDAHLLPGPYASITVADTGHGMDPGTLAQIFDPYFTTKGADGHGLGLSTALGIVAQSDGLLSASSERGAGTTFEVLLPVSAALERRLVLVA